MVNFLLGQQPGFTKYPCFLCIWDSRDQAQHYTKNYCALRKELVPCSAQNIINNLLEDRDRILGIIKQFTKALDKDGGCFTYLCHAFPGLTIEMFLKSVAHQRCRALKLNERRRTGSPESFYLGREELS